MAKKTATYGDYELRVEDNGKIVILNDSQPVQNAMSAIRTISTEVGFALDPKWNTQSSGRKLVDFLNSNATTSKSAANPSPESKANAAPSPIPKSEAKATPASTPKSEIKDTPSPAPKHEAKEAGRKKENELTEEEMEELLKQIAELRKTIESLESRITKLEKDQVAKPSVKTPENNGKDYQKEEFKINLTSYVRDEDGSITKFWKSAKKVNYDTHSDNCYNTLILSANGRVANLNKWATSVWSWAHRENNEVFLLLNEIADDKGHKFSFDVPDQLPEDGNEQYELLKGMINDLVKTFGKGGVAFIDNYMLKFNDGRIYKLGSEVMDDIVKFLSTPAIIKREWDNEPFVDNLDWSDAERYEAIKKYVKSLKKRY